jgi:hypothetical protein
MGIVADPATPVLRNAACNGLHCKRFFIHAPIAHETRQGPPSLASLQELYRFIIATSTPPRHSSALQQLKSHQRRGAHPQHGGMRERRVAGDRTRIRHLVG